MGDGGGDIIIKGGSVDLDFDETLYHKDPADPKKHRNSTRKIIRVLVKDDGGTTKYDSGTDQGGLNWTITVSTR